jgi:septal ring factor EnvC (AmiA/AmiB activator)
MMTDPFKEAIMYKIILVAAIVALQWMPISTYADTIYSWKDANGITRFSNEPPPEGVTDFKVTSSEATQASEPASGDTRRSSYDAMVDKASQEADQSREAREAKEAAEAAEKKRLAEQKRQARIQAERERLNKQIEAVKKRAVSPTQPYGMKQAQIEALTKEIEKLDQAASSADNKPEKADK